MLKAGVKLSKEEIIDLIVETGKILDAARCKSTTIFYEGKLVEIPKSWFSDKNTILLTEEREARLKKIGVNLRNA